MAMVKMNTESFLELKRENMELKSRIKLLEKDLIHDDLTSLKTRRYFEEELRSNLDLIFEKKDHSRKEVFGFKRISVLFLDIDNFKVINDTYGHDAGDEVLRLVAKILIKNVRKTDMAARFGGEEFAVALLGAGRESAYEKAERIRKDFETAEIVNYPEMKITASIGVAEAKDKHVSRLIKNADMAMYDAKQSGKNKTVISEI